MGKIVTISLGGATGAAGFTSDAQASAFADTIWDTFLGGSSSTRPFGGAVLDGVDLDIEGGSTIYFDSFVNQLRTLASGANKQYYVTAAPQCPYPDAYLGTVLNEVGFDAVYVQFYNNYCQLTSFSNANDWDFSDWDNWAKTVAINKDVKIYIGAPASSSAAGSGYVDVNTLANIALTTRSQYSSFGGVMLWDASQAYANDRFDAAIKSAIIEGSGGSSSSIPVTVTTSTQSASSSAPSTTTLSTISSSTPSTTTLSTISTTTTSTLSAPTGAGNCAGVNAWVANVAYIGGDEVVYNGHLWTAKWWSYADIPGGVAGDWTDDGACVAAALRVGQFITPITRASLYR
ncbi:Chitinase 2 [Grifola frondosa]|uniref:chitinase n=1 Tax=Grifola frondosa TaxID=5627 RepID=A0A1C7M586_GRIFR|nr:Chitinase 2 [Grifola frondosa]